MRFLKYIKLNNYINLKHAELKGLKDLNIIIGPNNCGKTSFLSAVNLLGRLEFGKHGQNFSCGTCNASIRKNENIQSVRGSINVREKYLTKGNVRAVFGYNKSEIMKVVPRFSERQNGILTSFRNDPNISNHLTSEFTQENLEMKEKSRQLVAEHVSPIIWNEVTTNLFGHILFCPDERLQNYKGNTIPKHIESKNFATLEDTRLIEFINKIADSKILDIRRSLELVRHVENQRFNTPIAEQGSGVKSIICVMADIISATETKILLVDEPELGLNPSGKHEFLKFLMEQSKDKQIFLATHDPTFVNPILWNRENVSVYLFSTIKDEFVKVNLVQSKQDPNTFAGFLPHTTSLKQVHIYVEGTTDVYIFQMFLNRYVKEKFKEDWYRILNKIGIFHLGGDFWSHLLYTIPKSPYSSIVILDGDKMNTLRTVIEKYSKIDEGRFKLCTVSDLPNLDKMKPCPIYLLTSPQIEDCLEPRPTSKDEGPVIAYKMDYVPPEIEKLFDAVFRKANLE